MEKYVEVTASNPKSKVKQKKVWKFTGNMGVVLAKTIRRIQVVFPEWSVEAIKFSDKEIKGAEEEPGKDRVTQPTNQKWWKRKVEQRKAEEAARLKEEERQKETLIEIDEVPEDEVMSTNPSGPEKVDPQDEPVEQEEEKQPETLDPAPASKPKKNAPTEKSSDKDEDLY